MVTQRLRRREGLYFLPRTLLFLASVLAARTARAQEPVRLAWNAPAGCPSGDVVRSDVQRILGGTTKHHAVARADVTQIGPANWSVHLVTDVDGSQGERTLNANSCESLAKATALILALTVDPARARAALATRQTPGGAPRPAPPPATVRPAEPSRPLEPFALLAASGAFDLGSLPSAAAGGELALGVLLGPVRAELAGADWFAQDATKQVRGASESVRIHLIDATLRGCYRGRLGRRFEVDPCLGASLVFASTDGKGPSPEFTAQHEASFWGSARAELLAAWRLAGPLALRASVGAVAPLVRRNFVVALKPGKTVQVLHRPSFVAARATLGVEVRFP